MSSQGAMIITIAVLNFALGSLWYTFVGQKWMFGWGLSKKDINHKDPKPYLIAFIGSLWTTYGMFLLIKHIHPQGMKELLTLAIGTWVFIVVGIGAKHYAFALRSLSAFFTDYLLDLVGLILISILIYMNY